jgi:hypothetical protein
MLKLMIEVNGYTVSDLELALDEITRKVSEGYLSGMDSNDESNYQFNRTGNEEFKVNCDCGSGCRLCMGPYYCDDEGEMK